MMQFFAIQVSYLVQSFLQNEIDSDKVSLCCCV